MDFRNSTAYLRDSFLPFKDANVSIASSPVLYGLGIYTVFGACWDETAKQLCVFRLREHYRRLVESCRIMNFEPFDEKYSYIEFEELVTDLLHRNQARQDVLVRVTVFIDELMAGTKIVGLTNSLSMYLYPLTNFFPLSGVSVCISSWAKLADNNIPPRAKVTGAYASSSLMKNEALQNGFDDAIALDNSGHVAESTVANVFLIKDGTLITPDSADDILDGITRRSIFELAAQFGLPCRTAKIDRTELYIADEVFLCGSSAGITPVLNVDHRSIGTGQIGPITPRLIEAYHCLRHGQDPNFEHWLTRITTVDSRKAAHR